MLTIENTKFSKNKKRRFVSIDLFVNKILYPKKMEQRKLKTVFKNYWPNTSWLIYTRRNDQL